MDCRHSSAPGTSVSESNSVTVEIRCIFTRCKHFSSICFPCVFWSNRRHLFCQNVSCFMPCPGGLSNVSPSWESGEIPKEGSCVRDWKWWRPPYQIRAAVKFKYMIFDTSWTWLIIQARCRHVLGTFEQHCLVGVAGGYMFLGIAALRLHLCVQLSNTRGGRCATHRDWCKSVSQFSPR